MEKPIIEVKSVGKRYKITHERGRYVALRDVIATIAKRPFAFLLDKAKSATGLKKKEEFWALRGVNFSVKKGEVIGIIGHNGAGKSTLLKILSQITPPTEGEIILRGRVGSLLEVGTGFHPELSGRENIFLNGAILGMHRREIAAKFDQIVDFAGIEKFLDTPVKYYSSGMYVRLAFSVAAHMEPDILLVDEVLAVGDAEFQKKCLGKMDEITREQGRTILFVSHNMAAIEKLCPTSIVLSKGGVQFCGDTKEAISFYTRTVSEEVLDIKSRVGKARKGNHNTVLTSVRFENDSDEELSIAQTGKPLRVALSYESTGKDQLTNCRMSVSFKSISGERLFTCSTELTHTETINLSANGTLRCRIDSLPLTRGKYLVDVRIEINRQTEDHIIDAAVLEVENADFYGTGVLPTAWEGAGVLVKHTWIL